MEVNEKESFVEFSRSSHSHSHSHHSHHSEHSDHSHHSEHSEPAVDVHLVVLLDAPLRLFLRFKIHLPAVRVLEKSSFGFRVDVLTHGAEIVLLELLGEVGDADGVR